MQVRKSKLKQVEGLALSETQIDEIASSFDLDELVEKLEESYAALSARSCLRVLRRAVDLAHELPEELTDADLTILASLFDLPALERVCSVALRAHEARRDNWLETKELSMPSTARH